MMPDDDVPSPIDLCDESDARTWAGRAMVLRPWRVQVFAAIAEHLVPTDAALQVLELGSGPGFLAEHLLRAHPALQMVLLDMSVPMHHMAQERLEADLGRVRLVQRSFRQPDWGEGLGPFDHVVTNQAVHELRHKRHALALHTQVHALLRPGGSYLVADHFVGPGGMSDDRLYMRIDEQRDALRAAGFAEVDELLQLNGLVLHRARRGGV